MRHRTPHRVCVVYLAQPALPRSALTAFVPVLFGADAAVQLALVPFSRSRCDLFLSLSRFIGTEFHGEESSVAFSRSSVSSQIARGTLCQLALSKELQHMRKFEIYVRIHSFNLNLLYMATCKQADVHTHRSCNAVPLVWGSLRLTPNKSIIVVYLECITEFDTLQCLKMHEYLMGLWSAYEPHPKHNVSTIMY